MTTPDQKLAAVRLLLGDDLTTRLIEDQWNIVNEFNDPYEVRNNTTRASLNATQLSAEVIGALMEAVKVPAMELGERQQAAYGALTEDERKNWLKGGPKPEAYAAVTCAPFEDPCPEQLFADLKAHNAHLQALLEERYADTQLVRFEHGQMDLKGSVVGMIAEGLAQTLGLRQDGDNLANYVEVRMHHAEVGELVMSVQRSSGKTPHQFRREAEEELAKFKSEHGISD